MPSTHRRQQDAARRPSRTSGAFVLVCVLAGCAAEGRVAEGSDASMPTLDAALDAGTTDDARPGDAGTTATDAADTADASSVADARATDAATTDASPPASPVRALVAVSEDASAAVRSVTANAGFVPVYALDVPVRAGDVLRVRAQIEMTNDYVSPVRGAIRIVADGVAVGTWSSQNAIFDAGHHMPLWADALVATTADATVHLEAQLSAGRSDASPSVLVEDSYGHLVVEQHRLFASRSEAASAGAWMLASITRDVSEDIATFGTTGASVRTAAYSIAPVVAAGDRIRVYAQTTSVWTAAGHDMHGHGIFTGETRIGPWSTENTPWAIQTVPLFSDAWHAVTADGALPLAVTMHGVVGIGGGVLAGGGHLTALRFTPASGDVVAGSLVAFADAPVLADGSIVANSGWQTLVEAPIDANPGDGVRAVGTTLLTHPVGFAQGISCTVTLELLAGGAVVSASPIATKYVTPTLEVLPLRADLILDVGPAGADAARLRGICSREGASPTVGVIGSATRAIVEIFGPPR
ncbi:MAG: hypothetical protein IT379_12570 [Deltaproteobacteria bacterium]|nr:hypothetical protein [Deltaproteobacteria bacterium]